jgi:hypothetical protein
MPTKRKPVKKAVKRKPVKKAVKRKVTRRRQTGAGKVDDVYNFIHKNKGKIAGGLALAGLSGLSAYSNSRGQTTQPIDVGYGHGSGAFYTPKAVPFLGGGGGLIERMDLPVRQTRWYNN